MEKDNKKKDGDIDEQYLMSMMAGGVRKEGFENRTVPESDTPQSEAIRDKKKTERKGEQFSDYEALFFRNPHGNARNGKSVYIRPEFHERLTRIVRVIGEDKISLYAYLDNVLEYHFKEFGQQIKKSFDDKYKPIL